MIRPVQSKVDFVARELETVPWKLSLVPLELELVPVEIGGLSALCGMFPRHGRRRDRMVGLWR